MQLANDLTMYHDDEEDWPCDDEDWTDEEDDSGDSESAPCPECGAIIDSILDRCPKCGYWLTDEDRQNLWAGARKPAWLMITAWVVLAVFVVPIIAIVMAIFKSAPSR